MDKNMNGGQDLGYEHQTLSLHDWFKVYCTKEGIEIHGTPPNQDNFSEVVPWENIVSIAFLPAENWWDQDELYIFSRDRPESYVIPMEAEGASELLDLLIKKMLFPAELVISAISSPGKLYVWPEN